MRKTVKSTNILSQNLVSKTNKNTKIPANGQFENIQKQIDQENFDDANLQYINNEIKEVPSIEYDDLDIIMPDDLEICGVRILLNKEDDMELLD